MRAAACGESTAMKLRLEIDKGHGCILCMNCRSFALIWVANDNIYKCLPNDKMRCVHASPSKVSVQGHLTCQPDASALTLAETAVTCDMESFNSNCTPLLYIRVSLYIIPTLLTYFIYHGILVHHSNIIQPTYTL